MNFKLRTVLLPLLLLLAATGCGRSSGPEASAVDVPEELWCYPASQIFLPRPTERPSELFKIAADTLAELESGRPFADVARERSGDIDSKPLGGFLGFLKPEGEQNFYGALQATHPGDYSYPFESSQGAHILYRHTFEEGRALEAATTVAAYGFFVPWDDLQPGVGRTREEAAAFARELIGKIESGETPFVEAALQYAHKRPTREDVFLGRVRTSRSTKDLYDALAAVEPGQFAQPIETPQGFAVVRRGRLLRAIARHILIRHRDSVERSLSLRRSREEARARAEKVLAEADRDGGNWPDLVRRFSDDTPSVPLDGSFGVVGNGDAFPEMEQALLDIRPGTVGGRVVESPDGFHVLYRVR